MNVIRRLAMTAALGIMAIAGAAVAQQGAGAGTGSPELSKAEIPPPESLPDADRKEVVGTAQANREMAEFAARQVAENEASARRAAEGMAEYKAAVAERERIIRENEAAAAASEARYRAEMAEWERKVAACRAGDRSACAQD